MGNDFCHAELGFGVLRYGNARYNIYILHNQTGVFVFIPKYVTERNFNCRILRVACNRVPLCCEVVYKVKQQISRML